MDVTAEREKLFEYLKKTLEYQPESLKDIAVISKEMREILRDLEPRQAASNSILGTFPDFDSFLYYCSRLNLNNNREEKFQYCDWQLEDMHAALNNSEYAWIRARGGSKTRDAAILALWWTMQGKIVIWRSAGKKQLIEARRKLNMLKPIVSKVQEWKAILMNGAEISLGILSELDTNSSRGDCLIIDEERSASQLAVDDLIGCIDASPDPHTLHISTPAIGTPIENTFQVLSPLGLVSVHPWQDCYWLNRDSIERARAIMAKWRYDANYDCKWTVMGGAFFEPYVVECKFKPVHGKKYGGVDWNGTPGHVLVVIQQSVEGVHVLEEHLYDYDNPDSPREIEAYCRDNNISLEVEAGGANIGFLPAIKAKKLQWTRKIKQARVDKLIGGDKRIYIDPRKTPLTRKDLQKTAFKEGGKNEMEKRDDMHWVDALLHAVHGTSSNNLACVVH